MIEVCHSLYHTTTDETNLETQDGTPCRHRVVSATVMSLGGADAHGLPKSRNSDLTNIRITALADTLPCIVEQGRKTYIYSPISTTYRTNHWRLSLSKSVALRSRAVSIRGLSTACHYLTCNLIYDPFQQTFCQSRIRIRSRLFVRSLSASIWISMSGFVQSPVGHESLTKKRDAPVDHVGSFKLRHLMRSALPGRVKLAVSAAD